MASSSPSTTGGFGVELAPNASNLQRNAVNVAASMMYEDALARSHRSHQLQFMLTHEGIRALDPAELGRFVASLEAWTGEIVPLPVPTSSPPSPPTPRAQSAASVTPTIGPSPTTPTRSVQPRQSAPVTPTAPAPPGSKPKPKSKPQPKPSSRHKTVKAAIPGPKSAAVVRRILPAAPLNLTAAVSSPEPEMDGDVDELDQDTKPLSPCASAPRLPFAPPRVITAKSASLSGRGHAQPIAPTWACVRSG